MFHVFFGRFLYFNCYCFRLIMFLSLVNLDFESCICYYSTRQSTFKICPGFTEGLLLLKISVNAVRIVIGPLMYFRLSLI